MHFPKGIIHSQAKMTSKKIVRMAGPPFLWQRTSSLRSDFKPSIRLNQISVFTKLRRDESARQVLPKSFCHEHPATEPWEFSQLV